MTDDRLSHVYVFSFRLLSVTRCYLYTLLNHLSIFRGYHENGTKGLWLTPVNPTLLAIVGVALDLCAFQVLPRCVLGSLVSYRLPSSKLNLCCIFLYFDSIAPSASGNDR